MAGFIQTAREEGMARGMQRGMQRGIKRGMEQGMERGMEQGIEQGRVEGERAVLERLLVRRFGRLPAATAERLGRASGADLAAWAENVLDAETLGEVFGPGS